MTQRQTHEKGDTVKTSLFPEGATLIHSYSREEALEDGYLVDISSLAREAGFRFPVAVTTGIWALLDQKDLGGGQSVKGRTWDMLAILMWEIRKGQRGDTTHFAPLFITKADEQPHGVKMYAKCGPGDTPEPVITIMLPDED